MKIVFLLFPFLMLLSSCTSHQQTVVTINEVFQTDRDESANIDSPAIWHGPNGEHWILATAKEADGIFIADATNGQHIQIFGSKGQAPGQFNRPNGIFIFDDHAFVVERDNQRVQVLKLPEFSSIGFIGTELLTKPYGLFIYRDAEGINHLFVTDSYETAEGNIPPLSDLDRRIHHYTFTINNNTLDWQMVRMFGDTTAPGALSIVESIWGDPDYGQLLIAEEDTNQNVIKVYDLQGNYSGVTFGQSLFKGQVEGLALYQSGEKHGYWIITDQSHSDNRFHLFTRGDFKHVGSFRGSKTTNTDGIWLTRKSFGNFEMGAFFAVNDDGNVSAFDFKAIAEALGLSLND